MAWPHEEHQSVRNCRQSPLYERLAAQDACFGEKLGWERPNWFADKGLGETASDVYTYGRQNWFNAVGREHDAARNSAVLFDQTSFAKFTVTGRDSLAALQWIAANNIDRPIGSVIYTQLLDSSGGIQCDLTITRVDKDSFYIVTGTGFATHDFDWLKRNLPSNVDIQLSDVTETRSVLSLMGPASREILSRVTKTDVSNQAFQFATMQKLQIAGCAVTAIRITYVGELGFELHMAVADAPRVYDELFSHGASLGLKNAGYRAIESLRLEKGYRSWGAEIGPDHTPLEAGLGWATKLSSGVDFLGRAALEKQRDSGLKKMLAGFRVDDPSVVLLGRETIYRNGERVGWLATGGYGYTVEASLGYGYVRNSQGVTRDYVLQGSYELEVATQRVPAAVSLTAFYDPKMIKIRS
jgi:4-methylaminobutanoate oxidase (formaldehyde-forming)